MMAREIVATDPKGVWLGNKGRMCCPAHDDNTPSLLVSDGPKGPVFTCLAGCDFRPVRDAMKARGYLNGTYIPDPEAIARQEREANKERARKEAAACRIWCEAGPVK